MSQPLNLQWYCLACPVEAEGEVDGKPFYFRARGDSWWLAIGGDDPMLASEWRYEQPYGKPDGYEAGWMSEDEALTFIEQAIAKYRGTAA